MEEFKMAKTITYKQKMVNALREAGEQGLLTSDLVKIRPRYGGTLGNLYKDGYKIETTPVKNGNYKYVLISEPAQVVIRPKAKDKLFEAVEQFGEVSATELKIIMEMVGVELKFKGNTYKK
jgi:hypothetical protein